MELYIIIPISVLVGLFLFAFLSVLAMPLFYAFHATARHIERKPGCCCWGLRWTACIFHLFACLIARYLQFYAWVMHSYEIVGLERIPTDRPVLLIFYHGSGPIDLFFFTVQMYFKGRGVMRFVAELGNFSIPGSKKLLHNYAFPGPVEHCVSTLQSGHTLIIAPGGTREGLYATRQYETIWNNRAGFARVARGAKVDIIPIFTRNIRQTIIQLECCQRCTRGLYEKKKIGAALPLPIFFPTKLVTYVGKPIPWDTVDSPEELARLTQRTMDSMIATYQRFPATYCRGIWERFTKVQQLSTEI